MTTTRRITLATAVLAIAGSGAGGAATGATATTTATASPNTPLIGPPRILDTHIAPLTIPGTGVHRGARLPSGAELIYRQITIAGGESGHFTMQAPAGKRFLGAMFTNDPPIDVRIDNRTNYAGHTKVWVSVTIRPRSAGVATGRLYGLVR
jgi:hypothetical protein